MPNQMLNRSLQCVLLSLVTNAVFAKEVLVSQDTDLKRVLADVEPGDTIVLCNGIWKDPELRFDSLSGTQEHPIHIRGQSPGKVVMTGEIEFRLSGTHVVVSGLNLKDPTGSSDVFELRSHSQRHAHHCRVTDCSFEQTQDSGSTKESRWLNVYGTNNRIDHCYFAGKRNGGTTLVVWVADKAGSHRIDHNHFGPRPKLGKNGGETIRIGTSGVSERVNRTVVEENYFDRCSGEAEIISNKSCENTFRHNLFEECSGALTLRHGHRCLVDGNVFLGHQASGTGGVRIIGRDHRVTNNYFEGLRGDAERAALCFMNGIQDGPLNGYAPVLNAQVAHNTFIDCKVSIEFGVSPSKKVSVAPTSCRVTHNAFLPGKWELFRVQTEPSDFLWMANRLQAGQKRGADLVEIQQVDIKLRRATDGLLRPSLTTGLKTKEPSDVTVDIDGAARESNIAGCDDPSTEIKVRDLAKTTGPQWRK